VNERGEDENENEENDRADRAEEDDVLTVTLNASQLPKRLPQPTYFTIYPKINDPVPQLFLQHLH